MLEMNQPTVPVTPEEPDPNPSGTPGLRQPDPRRGRWLYAFMGALVMGAGIGLGWLIGSQDAPTAASTVTTVSNGVATSPTIEAAVEPVAAVADALLPSVVQIESPTGLGSGFVYEDGHVLTAAHVVEGNDDVAIRFADGRQAQGTVVGSDAAKDIAVIAVDTTGIPVAALALDGEPVVGQMAVALGSPWDLEGTVTAGIVSAVDQAVPGPEGPQALLQTDAPINPGNSGGPLADRTGRVIGVNVEIFSFTGANSGVGFAVPIAVAYDLAGQLVAGTPIETAFLGVSGEDATGNQAGALIAEVVAGGPAEAAGLQVGDVVVAVNATEVHSMTELAARVRGFQPGDEVVLDVLRDGELINVTAVLGARQVDS
jgi:S1-C subfamily serine protease